MEPVYLQPHIRHCDLDGGTVVLNLRTRKYLALPPECTRALQLSEDDDLKDGCRSSETAQSADPDIQKGLELLIDADIVSRDRAKRRPPAVSPPQPCESLMAETYISHQARIRPRIALAFLSAMVAAKFRLRYGTLEQFIQAIDKKKAKMSPVQAATDLERVRELFGLFRAQRLWAYTAHGSCLFDSLTLVYFLLHIGIASTLVIGVCSKPFGAHAWVQIDDLVLNDTVERVSLFTPILSV